MATSKHLHDAMLGEIQALGRETNRKLKRMRAMVDPPPNRSSGKASALLDPKPLIERAGSLVKHIDGLDNHMLHVLAEFKAFAEDVQSFLAGPGPDRSN